MHFAALNVKNTYLFYVLCRFLVLIFVLKRSNKYYVFGLALPASDVDCKTTELTQNFTPRQGGFTAPLST